MGIDTRETFLEEAMKYASHEARHHVADALYCHLHNTGQSLAGNTQESDVEWFARIMWEQSGRKHGDRWEIELDAVKDNYRKFSALALGNMSKVQERIADRLIELSKVLQDIERAERAARKALERKSK